MPTVEIKYKPKPNEPVTFSYIGDKHPTFCPDCFLYGYGCSGISQTKNRTALIDISRPNVKKSIQSETADTRCGILPVLRESKK